MDAFAEAKAAIDPERWIEVRYEDFVRDPIATTKGVAEFMGLPWSTAFEDRSAATRSTSPGPKRSAVTSTLPTCRRSKRDRPTSEGAGVSPAAEGGDTAMTRPRVGGASPDRAGRGSHDPRGGTCECRHGDVQRLDRRERDELASTHVRGDIAGQITAVLDWVDPSANLNMFLYNAAGTIVQSATGGREAGADRTPSDDDGYMEDRDQGEDGIHDVRPPGGLPRLLVRRCPDLRRDAGWRDRRSRRHVPVRARRRRFGERVRRRHW